MDYSDLREWLTNKRAVSTPAIEQELLDWPDNRWGQCSGILDYFGRLGKEFTSRCGAVVTENADKLWNCATDLTTPMGLLESAKKCVDTATELGESWGSRAGVAGNLTKCTLTSYILAAEMTAQQREDWITFINGLDDLNSLFEVSELFEEGDLGLINEISAPKKSENREELREAIEKIKEDLEDRAEKAGEIPGKMGSVKSAILTIQPFSNLYLRARHEETVEALQECRIDAARDLYTMTRLQMIRQIGSLRAAVVLAEDQFYCAAQNIRFHALDFQGEILSGTYGGTLAEYNALQRANREHLRALEMYEELINDPRLSETSFKRMENEFLYEENKIQPVLEVADACIESCGKRVTGRTQPAMPITPLGLPPGITEAIDVAVGQSGPKECTLPLDTLITALQSESSSACSEEVRTKLRQEIEQHLLDLDKALTARNRAKTIIEQYRRAAQPWMDACPPERTGLDKVKTELNSAIQLDEQAYGFPNAACYDAVAEIEDAIRARQATCMGQSEGSDAGTVETKDSAKKVYFIYSVTGRGFVQKYGSVYVQAGMDEHILELKRGESLREALTKKQQEILGGDMCDKLQPSPFPPKYPALWNAGPQIKVVAGPLLKGSDVDAIVLQDTWHTESDDGPSLDPLRDTYCN